MHCIVPGARKSPERHYIRIAPEVQALFPPWTEPTGFLGQITAHARRRAVALAPTRATLEMSAAAAPGAASFELALRGECVAVIAEVKRRSPSKGDIRPEIDAAAQAIAYAEGGARAVSVLTEPDHFGGSLDDLARARAAVIVPLLRKDFLVSRLQLLEARASGASAVLLIARALQPSELTELVREARALDLTPLVEIRSEGELDAALRAGATVIGVNNRDLETLVITEGHAEQLIPLVPAHCLAIAESGIRSAADVERAAAAGADAVLVGSLVSAASDPARALRPLTAVPRRGRDRHG
ncbi:MAG: indole-3-glycerol phosphate synthase TrpC [Gemmatimonadaceae bacterium]